MENFPSSKRLNAAGMNAVAGPLAAAQLPELYDFAGRTASKHMPRFGRAVCRRGL